MVLCGCYLGHADFIEFAWIIVEDLTGLLIIIVDDAFRMLKLWHQGKTKLNLADKWMQVLLHVVG